MTIKTVSGPSIRAALTEARQLFGDDAVLLGSAEPSVNGPATVTVAFDAPIPMPAPPPAAPIAPPVHAPEPPTTPRAYGYASVAARHVSPSPPEAPSAPLAAPVAEPSAPVVYTNAPASDALTPEIVPTLAVPDPTASAPTASAPTASASNAEVAALRERLAKLERALEAAGIPSDPPRRPRRTLVFVGPGGVGKTSLAVRLGLRPDLADAESPAVLILAPESGPYVDAAPLFWEIGVPVAVARTPDEVREALDALGDPDLLLVDTPALPLDPDRARPAIARLGALLAPLAPLDVHLVVDAPRALAGLTAERLDALGLRPDALALTRLDEAAPGAAHAWADALDLPLRYVAAGPEAHDLDRLAPRIAASARSESGARYAVRPLLLDDAPAFA